MRARQVLVAIALAVCALYAADFLCARFGLLTHGASYGSVVVNETYSVTQKDKKQEFYFLPPQAETCVHALFPHFGAPPCWYLERHRQQTVQM